MYLKFALLSPLVVCLAAFPQVPAPAPAGATSVGPTMQQTVKFLSDMLEKQGPLSMQVLSNASEYSVWSGTLSMEGECTLAETTQFRTPPKFFHRELVTLDLSRSEPGSVAISPSTRYTPQVFYLEVKKAYREVRSPTLPRDNSPALPISQGEEVTGVIQSNVSGNLLIVTEDGQLRTYAPSAKIKVTVFRDDKNVPAALSDAAPDDTAIIRTKDKSITLLKGDPVRLKGYGPQVVAIVSDQETANRMAKALIHALVLCHKNEEPQPF